MNTHTNILRLLGLALIAVIAAFDGAVADASPSHPCHVGLDGCVVCKMNGGTCTAVFCPDGSIDHNCF